MRVIKVINNNTVCVKDEKGREQIISAKGVGFGKKYGDDIQPPDDCKFYMISDSSLRKKLIEELSEIPFEVLEATDEMIKHISDKLGKTFNESLIIPLSDHIAFAIQRKNEGTEFENPLMDSISDNFPEELALGRYCVEQIKEKLGTELCDSESGFIAMHIINARMGTKMSQISDITKLVDDCCTIVDSHFAGKVDKTTIAYERFLVHLKFLAKRLFGSEELPNVLSRDEEIVSFVSEKMQKQYKCAKRIQDYILKNYAKTISEDEMITLAIHLRRIAK